MDRLNGSARLMIVSDLDFTMVDHHDPENFALLRFNALWEAYYRHNSLLVFSTGRSPTIYGELRKQRPLLTPDITIMSVGTEITYGEAMIPDDSWKQYLDHKWDRGIVTEETAKFPELTLQSETEQRPHKVSFYVEKTKASEVMQALSKNLEKRGMYMSTKTAAEVVLELRNTIFEVLLQYYFVLCQLDVKIIYSNGVALDILPQGAGKGQALAYLLEKLKAEGRGPVKVLVCGDSGNDAELFTVPEVYGVMVSNAHEELLEWYAENARGNPQIMHATGRCAAGIIQAFGNFSLGPHVSPRDVRDSEERNQRILNPGHEVVNFYLFYERWRRGEVENSELYMQNLRTLFNSSANYVHPSGIDQPIHQVIDTLAKLYGDKRETDFWVWVDCVSFAEISRDSWLVRFNKWEISGNELLCCLTKGLMNSKVDAPHELTWMYLHQTWLDGSVPDNDKTWCI